MDEQKKYHLTGYNLVNLEELVLQVGEERAKEVLSDFSCPLNADVEYFLRHKAIEFSKQRLAQTHLVFTSYQEKVVLIGYFTLANKEIVILKGNKLLSAKWKRRVNRFALRSELDGGYHIPAPLIGQLGKNFQNGQNKLITGDELLKLATDKVRETQLILGGKFVYLECEDMPQLLRFYQDNGFVDFGRRDLEKDERDRQSGNYLVQLLKYIE